MKRGFDLLIAFLALIVAAPPLLLLAFLILLFLGRPVLFRQDRPGKNEDVFRLVKFRTMKNISPNLSCEVLDEARMTKLGSFLRSTSLDELPSLWNVLKGDMSLVGPRPLLVEYLSLYSPLQARRHDVRPGVTGWAQVNGRNAISWAEKFELDMWYVENQTFWLDVKILMLTVKKVLTRAGVSAEGRATASKFEGN